MKHCLECLIYLLNRNKNLAVNGEVKSSKYMLIKTEYPNLLHDYDFLSSNVMNYWVWEYVVNHALSCGITYMQCVHMEELISTSCIAFCTHCGPMLLHSMLLPILHLLSGFQTVISCTEDTTRQTLFFFAEFHFTWILQDACKTTCGSVQKKDCEIYYCLNV